MVSLGGRLVRLPGGARLAGEAFNVASSLFGSVASDWRSGDYLGSALDVAAGLEFGAIGAAIIGAGALAVVVPDEGGGMCFSENPNAGLVSQEPTQNGTFYGDPNGNMIPTPPGGGLNGSPDGVWLQAVDADGEPTGVRIDGPEGSRHGRVPGVTVPDPNYPSGNPHLPPSSKKQTMDEHQLIGMLLQATYLVQRAVNKEIDFDAFIREYDNFYYYYALDGHESAADENVLLGKYRTFIDFHKKVQTKAINLLHSAPESQRLMYDRAGRLDAGQVLTRLKELVVQHDVPSLLRVLERCSVEKSPSP